MASLTVAIEEVTCDHHNIITPFSLAPRSISLDDIQWNGGEEAEEGNGMDHFRISVIKSFTRRANGQHVKS